MNRPVPVSNRGRYLGKLLAERDWEHLSLYELELLRGMVEVAHDPEYIKTYWKKREEKEQQKSMEEKPFQFDILEYVEQTKKPVIDEVFLREFYKLSQEEQAQVADTLGRFHRSHMYMKAGEDISCHIEYLRIKRVDAFLDQWAEEQTKGWVATEVAVARTKAMQDRVKASREEG